MTTKQEKSDKCCIGVAINPKDEYLVGLSEAEAKTLRNLLGSSLSTGKLSTLGTQIIHSIYQKVSESLKGSRPNSDGLSLQQQNSALRLKLQECRRRLNCLEDRLDASEAARNDLEDELEVGEVLL